MYEDVWVAAVVHLAGSGEEGRAVQGGIDGVEVGPSEGRGGSGEEAQELLLCELRDRLQRP